MIAKSLLGTLTGWDCLGVTAILAFTLGNLVTSHMFPKRPDVFKDVALLQAQVIDLIKQVDVVESDVAAVRMANTRR